MSLAAENFVLYFTKYSHATASCPQQIRELFKAVEKGLSLNVSYKFFIPEVIPGDQARRFTISVSRAEK